MPPVYLPLRWESTGDQWWYASPIDWAAANGHYDVVLELLRLDANLLIKLTSLRRIRRLETVWDDDAQFVDAAMYRSIVARNLLLECETKKERNSLICAGYGGWLLYTAASAGDMVFIQELLEREPLLVFGEGEYGVTDIFYAAARSKNSEVFKLLFDYSVSPRCSLGCGGELVVRSHENVPSIFRWEMMNRAVHAVARGGNLEILREFLGYCSDVSAYRDVQGSTVLHAASGRGQVEVVKDLVASFDIIRMKDNQGNTALHVAAYRGHLCVVEALIHASPSTTSSINNAGDTFLHMAVAGFRTPGFRRLDRQIELMTQLVCGKKVNLQEIINIRNNHGRTALHMAVTGNIHSNLVELLMSVQSIDLNIRDADGLTPLDVLSRRPQSASSEILIKHLVSAGGISKSKDHVARSAIASHLKLQSTSSSSPGTSFRISDAEIFLYASIENGLDASGDGGSERLSSCSSTSKSEFSHIETVNDNHGFLSNNKKLTSVNYAARRLKILLGWPHRKEKKVDCNFTESYRILEDNDLFESSKKFSSFEDMPIPLRQQFSRPSILPNNKRTLSVRSSLPSPSTKKKFAAGLMHGVIQAIPHLGFPSHSRSSSFSRSPLSSPMLLDKQKVILLDNESSGPSCSKTSFDDGTQDMSPKSILANNKLMNQYFCFGAQGLSLDDSICRPQSSRAYKHSVLSMA
ncbi:uncharacterized protein LOC131239933 [Magnolia sinica]|uniref:uncharacterized protein LOC131239933 n=1 Tax=Magnolia sinica TaxID=86752 RepID=UPI002659F259|nr:uncharacterized protein LOC131239933 [Magnolia sinica]